MTVSACGCSWRSPRKANEETWLRTIELVEDDDFQQARRRLWSWEQTLSPNSDVREVTAGLKALVDDYNVVVRRQKLVTTAKWVFLIVPALVGAGLDAVAGGLIGTAAGIGAPVLFDRVKAKFPAVAGEASRASHHPGSAVQGLLAIAGPAAPPR